MQLEYNGFVSLLPTLSLLAAWAALGLLRSRDVLAEALDNPSRYLQWGLMFGAVLTLLEATTTLPVFDLVRLVHNALNIEITQLSGAPVTPITIATVLVVVFGSWWISTLARDGIARVMLSRSIGDEGSIGAISRLVQYVVVGSGIAVGLQTMGLNLSAVLTAGAVFAVGIGLAMQHVAENFVSGVILLVERTIRPGDVLEVDGALVRVEYLGIRSTVARTLDDEEVIFPNSLLVQTQIKNLRLTDTLLRIRMQVGVTYDSDLKKTMAALERAALTLPQVASRPPVILLTGFGSSSVDFDVSVWSQSPWDKMRVKSALGLAIWNALKEEGIVIAFPQLDLHVDDALVKAIHGKAPPAGD
jgi:potassium-dependent mechanosensitive channel